MEVPAVIKTWVDSDGVTVYTVQYKDGSTCDMTVQQYDYLKASADAVVDLDARQNDQKVKNQIQMIPMTQMKNRINTN